MLTAEKKPSLSMRKTVLTMFKNLIFLSILWALPVSVHAEVVLNGYTFSDDSVNIWENQFLSDYVKSDTSCLYYGSRSYTEFGNWADLYVAKWFDEIDYYQGIACVVEREHGFWPKVKWENGIPTGIETFERYTRYNYLAKDIDDNIHILQSLRDNETDKSVNDSEIITEGGTTLLFPQHPELFQAVYTGYVASLSGSTSETGTYTNCMSYYTLIKTGLASENLMDVIVFVKPGIGIVEMGYNWIVQAVNNGYTLSGRYNGDPANPPQDVTIHGFTFSDDSAQLWDNQYFDNYTAANINTFSKILYGYGDFEGYDNTYYFDSYGTYENIDCIVIRERGYTPAYASGAFTMTPYTIYNYWAKDINDNIHLLMTKTSAGVETTADSIISAGGTTLIYPNAPVSRQFVYDGFVWELSASVGDYTSCLSLRRGVAPSIVFDYYQVDAGLVTKVYNWGDSVNGFSLDETPDLPSLPAQGGTDPGTGTDTGGTSTGTTDTTGTAVVDDDDDHRNWYQCFITTTQSGHTDSALIFIMIICWVCAMACIPKTSSASN